MATLRRQRAEVYVSASNTADNGIKYGVTIELNAGAADGAAADEAYAFISSDWGRLELGDNDDAADKLSVGSYQVNKGTGGPYGGLGTQSLFSGRGGEASAPTFSGRAASPATQPRRPIYRRRSVASRSAPR